MSNTGFPNPAVTGQPQITPANIGSIIIEWKLVGNSNLVYFPVITIYFGSYVKIVSTSEVATYISILQMKANILGGGNAVISFMFTNDITIITVGIPLIEPPVYAIDFTADGFLGIEGAMFISPLGFLGNTQSSLILDNTTQEVRALVGSSQMLFIASTFGTNNMCFIFLDKTLKPIIANNSAYFQQNPLLDIISYPNLSAVNIGYLYIRNVLVNGFVIKAMNNSVISNITVGGLATTGVYPFPINSIDFTYTYTNGNPKDVVVTLTSLGTATTILLIDSTGNAFTLIPALGANTFPAKNVSSGFFIAVF